MITVVIQDEQGLELDRFNMIHAEFEDSDKFPQGTFLTTLSPETALKHPGSVTARISRAAYFQGRAGGA